MTRITPFLLFCALFATQTLNGCGDSESAPAPTGPGAIGPAPTVQSPAAAPAGAVAGWVSDTAFRPIADAVIEVLDGPEPGASARSDAEGQFRLQGQTFRATKAGYVSATQEANPSRGQWIIFLLQLQSPPTVNVAGDYTMTVTADAACASKLPENARIRNYAVTVAPAESPYNPVDTNFSVRHHNANVSNYWDMSLGVAGDFVGFGIYGGHNPFLMEWLTPESNIAFSGTSPGVSIAAGASTISTSFDGIVAYCRVARAGSVEGSCLSPVDSCEARNHRLTLTRR